MSSPCRPNLSPPPLTGSIPSFLPDDLFLNSATATRVLSSPCSAGKGLALVASVHAGLLKSGLLPSNLYVANALVDAYAKGGRMDLAAKMFDRMPQRDVVSWTSMVSGYCRDGAADAALSVFRSMLDGEEDQPVQPNEFTLAAVLQACGAERNEGVGRMVHGCLVTNGFASDPFASNSLIGMYARCGLPVSARKVLSTSSSGDVVSWTSLISGCVEAGLVEDAVVAFVRMMNVGTLPNLVTMLSIIRACSLMKESSLFGAIHALIIKLELQFDVVIANSLLEMYSRNAFVSESLCFFSILHISNGCLDPEAVALFLHACSSSSSLKIGESIHGYLFKLAFFPSTYLENSLTDMYAKCGEVDSACRVFAGMNTRDIISWNTMISCFVKNSRPSDALQLLAHVHSNCELALDFSTMLSSIDACSELAVLQDGQILHGYVIRAGLDGDIFIGNALIDMYAKAGAIGFACRTFKEMHNRDIGSWNSMIAAFGMHGDGKSALEVFYELERCSGEYPNMISFLNVISACSHSSLVDQGIEIFHRMIRDYRIDPRMEHYASMVDLFGRSRKLREALNFVRSMPVAPDSSIWRSLLNAAGICGNVDIAEMAAQRLCYMEPSCNAWKVALANIYSSAGLWQLAANMRAKIREKCSRKEAGWSSVELGGRESYRFIVADTRHPESSRIYEVLNGITEHIADVFSLERPPCQLEGG